MGCLRNKNRSNLISKKRIYALESRWFYVAYMWKDRASMIAASDDGVECNAFCCHSPWRESVNGSFRTRFIPPFRGEIHFNSECWNMESVAHECLHASITLAGQIGLSPTKVFSGDGELSLCLPDEITESVRSSRTDEEILCYIHGDMVDKVYRFLWECSPCDKWEKVEGKR